jgi:peptidoglycan L-alanyl-D-glutamate endopeptidase CwlK
MKDSLLQQIAKLQALLQTLSFQRPARLTNLVQRKADEVIAEMTTFGYKVMVYQGFRSFAGQDALYAQGRTKPGTVVTNAKGGDSLHNYGCAVDIVFIENGRPSWAEHHPWHILGAIGKKHGFEWGGDWASFPDRPHLQITMGYTLQDFKKNKVNYLKYV